MMYHVSNKFLKKLEFTSKFGYFHFSVSSSILLTASWLAIFVSAELVEQNYQLINLNQDLKVIQGVK